MVLFKHMDIVRDCWWIARSVGVGGWVIKSKTAAHGSLYTTHSSPRYLEEVCDGRDKRASHGLTDSRLAPGDDEEGGGGVFHGSELRVSS